ncbi:MULTISPECIES: exopolyphosphatase [Idiomarina]|uniref:Ppx/GppA phosphatase family protein n=1 Tax=Idiomarina TaxID=135575 RepID=UPI00129C7941|nr:MULTISPECIES: exopolyphosphatase [Idiomarina]MRJ42684.1 exopolyphosphatase [Idiomarina sp. FeN1]NCU57896.1 exopolyphosphatase [Idiomarina sp. FenA--70]NCU60448.1 exopolyphosphatase [Idiomarina sp. FenBw--71]UUN13540.1 exopolyphosphatase [Idiomarina loihiensis]
MTDVHSPQTQLADGLNYFAALDLGSNSFHLVTTRVIDQHVQPLLKFKQKVRLASGLSKTNKLSEEAIQRGLAALQLCAQRLQGFATEQVYVVATHTLREAKNADVFLARAAEIFPFPIHIISGHEEARLIYRGVAQTSSYQGRRLVIDIGGGSTEIIAGEEFEPKILASRSMGCVSFTERFFKDGKLSEKRFKKALIAARSELEPVAAGLRKFNAVEVIGTSGTIKAIAQWVQLRDQSAPDVITRTALQRCVEQLLTHTNISSFNEAAIDADRHGVIAAGLAVLVAVMDELELTSLTCHDAALREGVLYELAERVIGHRDVRQRTIDGMAARYQVDELQAQRVAETAVYLLRQVAKPWQLQQPAWRQRLQWAARVHEVGLQINASSLQSHSGYIIEHADMPGFSKEEQAFLAALVRNYRKKLQLERLPQLYLFEQRDLWRMIVLLRLAVLFNTDRQSSLLLKKIQVRQDTLLLTLTKEGSANPMLLNDLALEAKQQAKLGINLRVHG